MAAVYIPYRGRQGSFRYISAKDVHAGFARADHLNGKIALLGASAAGLLDLRSTPVSQRYIGVEVHANIIGGLLDGNIRQQPSYAPGLEMFLLFVTALLTVSVLPRLSPLSALLFLVTLLGAIMAPNLWFWSSLNLTIPMASLICYTLIASLLQINYGFFVESRNKRHLSRVFGQYIPPSLVEEMDDCGQEAKLEGETRDMSVLFSDVRGFTTLSEKLDARELTHLMNEFLTPITGVIQEYRGTIDKYMGDTVNLGSRLEGLTREYGVDMIISEGTLERIDDIVVRELDLVQVKGKTEPVAIYEPLGIASDVSADQKAMVNEFGEALLAYRQREWDKAEEKLRGLKDLNDELLYNVYLDRIERFKVNAPANDWTGVFQHLTK